MLRLEDEELCQQRWELMTTAELLPFDQEKVWRRKGR
jgi:hypothetical protein